MVPEGADITVRLTPSVGQAVDVSIQLYQEGRLSATSSSPTTSPLSASPNSFDHELFHTFQWTAAGGVPFAVLYASEYASAGGVCDRFEGAAGFIKGNYDECVR